MICGWTDGVFPLQSWCSPTLPRPPEKLFLRCRGCRGGRAGPGTCSSSGSSKERARRSLRGTKCLERRGGCRGGGGGDSRDSCSAGREWGLRTRKLPPPPIPRHLEDRPKLFQLDLRLHILGRAGRPQLWYREARPGHWHTQRTQVRIQYLNLNLSTNSPVFYAKLTLQDWND